MEPAFLSYPDPDDPRTHLALCRMCSLLRVNANPLALRYFFEQQFPGGSYTWRIAYINAYYSTSMLFKYGNTNLILSGGTQGSFHIQGMIAGWSNTSPNPTNLGASDQFAAARTGLLVDLGTGLFANGQRFVLAGYSYGGAQLAAMAAAIQVLYPASSIYLYSYGAPRPGTTVLQRQLDSVPGVRYFLPEDPIVKVPPHTDEAPLLHFALPNATSVGCNRQVQPGHGRLLRADGTIGIQEWSPIPLDVYTASLISWMVGSNAFGNSLHSVDNYINRFALAAAANVTVRARAAPPPEEQPLNITRRQRVHIEDVARTALPRGNFPANPLLQQVVLPVPGFRYRLRPMREGWGVVYGTDLYALCDTKRQAKALVREFNRNILKPGIPVPVDGNVAPLMDG
jgi:hypothetical protein